MLPAMIREHFRYPYMGILNLPGYKERVNIIVVTYILNKNVIIVGLQYSNAFDIAGIDLGSDWNAIFPIGRVSLRIIACP